MPCCVCSQIQLCREIHKSWQNPESSSCHRIGYYHKLFIQRFLKLQSLCVCVLSACLLVFDLHAWCTWRPEEGAGYPGTIVTDGWESKLGPL